MTEETVQQRLEGAVRDLWAMLQESGPDYVVFMDRRRMHTRVERRDDLYVVGWETEDGTWVEYDRPFENPREAALHGYQGPH
ncbi:MAG TPA: hypothetical protein VFB58_07105 [Chloroflexota bacterium]|nr:hypothetical protein [Chloroflexota bacterium]